MQKTSLRIGLYTILIFIVQTIDNTIMTPFTVVAMSYISETSLFVSSLVYMLVQAKQRLVVWAHPHFMMDMSRVM
ncbi:hypothetical protein [Virgibacillus proomii]|uniref:hypothetical protein n=1 Tax=Virgibacillus proomii TaxID=84407 RepID=UPI001C1103C5|nr:hypothetical protein [Virgibacillus proomii]MBU5267544.1 hypothetical protein [Virgibacillus proomii]